MDKKYPAQYTAHTPSGEIHCCEYHAKAVKAVFNHLGCHVAITQAPEGEQCNNCINENNHKESE